MKRILIVLPSFKPYSPIKFIVDLSIYLSHFFDVYLISIDANRGNKTLEDYIKNHGLRFFYLNCRNKIDLFKAMNLLNEIVSYIDPEVVLSSLLKSDFLVSPLKGDFLKVSTIREFTNMQYVADYGNILGRILSHLHFRILKKFDYTIVMSKQMKEMFKSAGISEEKIYIIPNGLNTEYVDKKVRENVNFPFKNNLPTIVTASLLTKRKNIELLIEVSLRLMYKGLEFNVLIIGDGPCKAKLEYMVNNSRFKDRFYFTGYIENPLPYIAKSSIYVSTSKSEGISRSLMEALYLKKLCIARNIPGNNELIKHNINGFLFNSKEELEKLLEKAINADTSKLNIFLPDKFLFKNVAYRYKIFLEEVLVNRSG